ncbi:hypothetical protein PIB30_081032 [Stylosanthes scabra]|uniref:Uncharacterized protein n=1 Tax=Stylosanthes scabra TaxID=79078 RepID=A0ABU6SSW8_9FABA|nr:hypothetical protein [Stylosanthes scabra]
MPMRQPSRLGVGITGSNKTHSCLSVSNPHLPTLNSPNLQQSPHPPLPPITTHPWITLPLPHTLFNPKRPSVHPHITLNIQFCKTKLCRLNLCPTTLKNFSRKRAKGSLESKKEENRVKGAKTELQYQTRVLTPRRHYPHLGVAEPPSPFSLIHHPTPRHDARRLGVDEAARKMTLHQGLNA